MESMFRDLDGVGVSIGLMSEVFENRSPLLVIVLGVLNTSPSSSSSSLICSQPRLPGESYALFLVVLCGVTGGGGMDTWSAILLMSSASSKRKS